MHKTHRPQTQKGTSYIRATAKARKGQAEAPVLSGPRYNRSVKHPNRQFDY